jgi:hypothetical protein
MTMGDRIKPGAVKASKAATEESGTALGSAADRSLDETSAGDDRPRGRAGSATDSRTNA